MTFAILAPMVVAYAVAINWAAYMAFAVDKACAVDNARLPAACHQRRPGYPRPARRVSEATLLLIAAMGGGPGAVLAQQRLRHKTRKEPFRTQLWLIVTIEAGLLIGFALF